MGRGPTYWAGILAACVLSAAGQTISAAESTATLRPLQVSDFFVPAGAGFVTDRIEPAPAGRTPVLIYIQEAHANPAAQRQIVRILEDLISQHGVRLILVEGGAGPVGLAHLRALAGPDKRREVAERYLDRGILSAEEYMDLVSDYPLTLWGVEEPALYDQNVAAMQEAESARSKAMALIAELRAALGPLETQVPAAVRAVEDAETAFAAQRAGLPDHAAALAQLAQQQDVSLDPFSAVTGFLEVRQREGAVDGPAIAADQKALLGRLGQLLPPEEFDRLLTQARGASAGPAARLAFYRQLQEMASRHGLPFEPYAHLSRHARLLADAAAINPQALSDQLKRLAAAIKDHASATPEQRDAAAVRRELDLVEKLAQLRLSPSEHETLTAGDSAAHWPAWRALLMRAGAVTATSRVDALAALVPALERFYAVARQRDEALLRNALAKLEASGEPAAVLITGGFHGPVLAERLRQRGLGAVIITPNVQQPTDERVYHAVLRYKSGQGSLDEVIAAAQSKPREE